MNYINPYELLSLEITNLNEINSSVIRRARTNLFNQIDLSVSDSNSIGYIEFRSKYITKADCIKTIDELDSKTKREFHFFIYQNKQLNDFLVDGNLSFFNNYKIESIYNLSEFVDFISPYFSEQYNRKLTEYFEKWNVSLTTKMLMVSPVVNTEYIEKCYSGVRVFLRSLIDDIEKLRSEFEKDNSFTVSAEFKNKYSYIKSTVNTRLINLLPSSQFQNIRNILGVNILGLAIFINNLENDKNDNDESKDFALCYSIAEFAKEIDCDGLEEKRIRDNYYILKKNLDQFSQKSKAANPLLDKYIALTALIADKISDVDTKTISLSSVRIWLATTINVSEINQLDSSFTEIKNTIGLLIRSLSVSIWNVHDNIDLALETIMKALAINTDSETRTKLQSSKDQLLGLKQKIAAQRLRAIQQIPQSLPPTRYSPQPSQEKDKTGCLVLLGIVAIFFIIAMISNSQHSSTSYSNFNSTSIPFTTDTASRTSTNTPLDDNYKRGNVAPVESIYTIVKVKNGNFPKCSGIKPEYNTELNTRMIISAELTDAAVKIYNSENNKCIRFVFINDGTTYTVNNIPQGLYYLKIAYGNNWSVKKNDPICKGHFTSNAIYKRDNETYNFYKDYKLDGRVYIPYYELKLYTTFSSGHSLSAPESNSISETDFNN